MGEEQFMAVQNATTLVGYHGAGLSWARWAHPDAAEIQLIGLPCSFESHSNMHFQKRYSIQHSILGGIGLNTNQTEEDYFCRLLHNREHRAKLSEEEIKYLSSRDGDVRHYDAVVDIPALVETIRKIDVTLNVNVHSA